MSLLNIINVGYQVGDTTLFENLSFAIESGDRLGLVGHNGCGKSSLLALLAGTLEADSGHIQRQRQLLIRSVAQFLPSALTTLTTFDALADALPADSRERRAYEVTTLLDQLGFSHDQHNQPITSLSGGQQNLLLFARAIIHGPDLLLLDEPNNHMDVRALAILQTYLTRPDVPAFIMISHDRELLDTVTNRTLWIRDKHAYHFACPYSQAKEALAAQDESDARRRANEQKKIDQLSLSAKRIANWAKVYDNEDFARKAKSMEKRIDKLKSAQTTVSMGTGLSLDVQAETLRAKQLLTLENSEFKTPNGEPLFETNTLTLKPGDRIALLGVNGSGKSTCIKQLIDAYHLPTDQQTRIRFNPRVRIGYLDQTLDQCQAAAGIHTWIRQQTTADADDIKRALIRWGFPYQSHTQPVNTLSGGQRTRLLLLTFQLLRPNFIIMDEPTNHLDLAGKETLERDLCHPNISLLFTSHDRRFIERVATRYWWIQNNTLIEIHDLSLFYESLQSPHDPPPPARATETYQGGENLPERGRGDHPRSLNDEDILEYICHLEQLLADDLARKPKHQKPARQSAWREAIARWSAQLN